MMRGDRHAVLGPSVMAAASALTVGYWLPALGLPRLDLAMLNGNLLVPETTSAAFGWSIGTIHTFLLSGLAAEVLHRWVDRRLPGGPATRGALWGLTLGMFAGLTLFPLLYGGGIFGLDWDPGFPVTLGLSFLTWGTVLGLGLDADDPA